MSTGLWIGTLASTQKTGTFESISSVTLSTNSAEITLGSIPQTYQHLMIRGMLRVVASSTSSNVAWRANSDTTWSNYYFLNLVGDGNSVYNGTYNDPGANLLFQGCVAGNTNASLYTPFVTEITDYARTDKKKVVRTIFGWQTNGSGAQIGIPSTIWNSNNAITSFTVRRWDSSSDYAAGSTISLYGIRAV